MVSWYGPTELIRAYRTSIEADNIARFLGGTPSEVGAGLYKEASPLTYVGENSPPTLVIQGTTDLIVPVAQARLLERTLAPFSPASRFIYIQGVGHGIPGYRDQSMQRSIDYLNRLFAP